jgi:hypothetical protein
MSNLFFGTYRINYNLSLLDLNESEENNVNVNEAETYMLFQVSYEASKWEQMGLCLVLYIHLEKQRERI